MGVARLRPRDRETAIHIENPTAFEDATWLFTERAYTVNTIKAVLRGSAGQSVTFSILWNANRASAGFVVIGSAVVTSTSGATFVPTGTTIPANVWVWVETSAQLGTVLEITVAMDLTP